MEESPKPEMLLADLSSLALQLAQWGCEHLFIAQFARLPLMQTPPHLTMVRSHGVAAAAPFSRRVRG
jgi:HrpA-like RNA helicase